MKNLKIYVFSVFLLFVLVIKLNAEGGDKKSKSQLVKTNGEPSIAHFNINNISTWIYNTGEADNDPRGNTGFEYPKGSNKQIVFQSGFLWGAKVDGQIRVGGSAYRSGLKPGKILNNNLPPNLLTAENPDDPHVRIYRTRRNYKTADLSSGVTFFDPSIEEIKAQYEKDWNEWPSKDGAPFEDINKNGKYDPQIDIPGYPGADQTIWFAANDLDSNQTKYLYGSLPMGIEMQVTIWGYASASPLSNIIFKKYKIINRSNTEFNEMYFGIWADPDVGDANDDFVGCDTLLDLGYGYNGREIDASYKKTVPSIGFKLLQGPIKNDESLNMTSFAFYIGGSNVYRDPNQAEYSGTLNVYGYLHGKIGNNRGPYIDPLTGDSTVFPLSGDPVLKTGFIDGIQLPPADRRLMVNSGPFNMAPGDTQEVVFAEIAAGGYNGFSRLAAVTQLKLFSSFAQTFYENNFLAPKIIFSPEITVSELDKQIILSWGNDQDQINQIENNKFGTYKFEGYNVYQLPIKDSKIQDAVKIASFDLKNEVTGIVGEYVDPGSGFILTRIEQEGSDSGIKRFINIQQDSIKHKKWLSNGSKYYFAVTAYFYSSEENIWPRSFETEIKAVEAIPQSFNPGVRLEGKFGEEINVKHSKGGSNGEVKAFVVNPDLLTGDEYKIHFDSSENNLEWELLNLNDSREVLSNQIVISESVNPIAEGIRITIENAVAGFKGDGAGIIMVKFDGKPLTPDQWDEDGAPYGGDAVWGRFPGANTGDFFLNTNRAFSLINEISKNLQYARDRDFEIRFTPNQNYGIYYYDDNKIANVPFELWDIGVNTSNDTSDDVRMIPFLKSNNGSKDIWEFATDTINNDVSCSDMIYFIDPLNKKSYQNFAQVCKAVGPGNIYPSGKGVDSNYFAVFHGDRKYVIGNVAFCTYYYYSNPELPSGTTIRFLTNKRITPGDEYTFEAPAITYNSDLAEEDVKKINVFPNPYYGRNPAETNKYERFITFNHLPRRAKIRIYNLGGHLVRTLEKDSPGQFLTWDLLNEHNLQAPSGLFIAYIEMPDLGTTKILKFVVIQELVVPDYY